MNISNTVLNAYKDYMKGNACGTQIKAIYIDKTATFETSEKQKAGLWFEYLLTGALLRDGSIPQPIKTKTGLDAAITKHLTGQKKNFETIYEGVEVIDKSVVLEYEEDGINYKGILDLVCKSNEDGIHIRDIKATGLIDNMWEETGWKLLEGDNYKPKKKHLSQAIIYTCLWWKLTGNIVPFYFDVFANTNPNDCKTIRCVIDENEIEYHWAGIVADAKSLIKMAEHDFFKSKPDLKRCRKCPVLDCKDRTNKPEVENIYL